MKKNFFKKLATVLSLAMVVTSVAPLAGTSASAAATPDIKTRRTTAYEGNSYSYAVKNAKGYTVKWAVSGKLATISKAGKLTVKTKGAKAGKVVVSATFYKKGKKVVTRKDSVAIKVSAKSVAISTKDAADLTAVPAGEVIDFNRKLTPANSTSKTYYTVAGKDGAATTTATIDKDGKFTATAVGEYVITATVRNAATSKVLTTVDQAVTVVHAIKEVKQTAVNKLVVTFSADASKAVTKDNITVVSDKKVKQVVKSVSFDVTGKVATVETYLSLSNDVAYTVSYDKSSSSFTAKVGDVATVVVKSKEVQYNTKTNLDITLLDGNGIDVTSDDNLAKVDVTTDKGWVDDNKTKQPKITLFNVGDVATVSATFHTGTYKDGKEVVSETAKATITAVKEIKDTGALVAATLAKTADGPDWSKATTTIAAEATGYQVYVKMKDVATGTEYDSNVYGSKFTYESTDSTTLLVYSNGSIYPVKEGTAYVKVTYGGTTEMVAVTVGAKAKATTISVNKPALTFSNLLTNTTTVEVKVKDQYGFDFPFTLSGSDITVTNPTGGSGLTAVPNGADKVDITATTATAAKDGYKVVIKAEGLYYSINVDVKNSTTTTTVSNAPVRVELGSTDVDVKFSTAAANFSIKAFEYTVDGVKSHELNGDTVTLPVALFTDFAFIVTDPDGKTITMDETGALTQHTDYTADAASILTGAPATGDVAFNASWIDGSSVLHKVKTGTWKVEVQVNRGSGLVTVASQGFAVKDTQTLPTIKTNKVVYDASYANNDPAATVILAAIQDAVDPLFTAKFADEPSDALTSRFSAVEFNAAATVFADNTKEYTVFVKNITVDKVIGTTTVPCKVTVNTYITIK